MGGIRPRPLATACPHAGHRPHYANGRCKQCHEAWYREVHPRPRATCHPNRVRYSADGKCVSCFVRDRRESQRERMEELQATALHLSAAALQLAEAATAGVM
jgi:hypothetical protein